MNDYSYCAAINITIILVVAAIIVFADNWWALLLFLGSQTPRGRKGEHSKQSVSKSE